MAVIDVDGMPIGEERAQEFWAQYVNNAVKAEKDRVDNRLDSDYYTKTDIESALENKCDKSDFSALAGRVETAQNDITALQAKDIYFGVYTGNNDYSIDIDTQDIDLGFTPKAVLVVKENGQMAYNTSFCGGLALLGHPAMSDYEIGSITIIDGGFNVSGDANDTGSVFYYIAIKSTNNIVVHE